MRRAEEFEELRPLLFSIAYRILGSVSEAEDAVQDTWLRFMASTTQPTSIKAFLSATVTRISIDVLRSGRARRETYIGPWFPEPLLTDPYDDPQRSAELADSTSMAALLLLERLSPLERAVFVLREVFGFGFPEIASAVGRSEAACRQLAVRARRHMDAGRPRFEADRRKRENLAARFFDALREGEVDGLRELLAADVQLVGDGGGKAPQLARAIIGADRVARLLASVFPRMFQIDVTFEPHEVNGQPGAVLRDRYGKVLNTVALDMADEQIQAIRLVINPDKLAHLGPVADAWAIDREVRRGHRQRPGRPAELPGRIVRRRAADAPIVRGLHARQVAGGDVTAAWAISSRSRSGSELGEVIHVRVFVAGGTGVLGQRLVPQLVARGHHVTATTTSRDKLSRVKQQGAEAIVMDGLDAASVGEAVATAQPDAIVHQMTAISVAHAGQADMKHFDRWFATTSRLRVEGTDHLLAAAAAAGVANFVAQSYASWNGVREGGWVKTEQDPLDPMIGTAAHAGMAAIGHVEDAVVKAGGAALRYGWFYGPGAIDDTVELVRKRQFPVVGTGAGHCSWVHLDDAARATVLAVEHKATGVFNVVDDEPAPASAWLPHLAECAGAKRPMHVPRWLARPVAGEVAVIMMTEGRGFSNAKAKRELDWQLRYPSWREGFRAGLS